MIVSKKSKNRIIFVFKIMVAKQNIFSWEKYNLTPQTTTILMDGPSNY
jgi:hypothetical protein